jgi:FMS-like tyrosine kinase 1
LKDGSPATENGYSLIIKDVTTEDAGDYTILLGIKQSNVFKNLTATLIVNGKFTFQTFFGLWEGENW